MNYHDHFDRLGNAKYKPVTDRINRRFLAMVSVAAIAVTTLLILWVIR